jgi:hypothetical protein
LKSHFASGSACRSSSWCFRRTAIRPISAAGPTLPRSNPPIGGFSFSFVGNPFDAPGIPNSICIKFDNTDNFGEGPDSTGLFINGDTPGLAGNPGDTLVDLRGIGIDLQSQDVFQVTLSYEGTILTETITDTVTGATFTHAYTVNIPALVGGNLGYVGFTEGNGFLAEKGDIQTWPYQFTSPTGDEGEEPERLGRSDRAAFGPAVAAEMRLLQGAALLMEDGALAAFFAPFANPSGGNSPAPASGPISGGAAAPKSLPDVKTVWLRAVEALPAPRNVQDDSLDAVFDTLNGRQELLNLFRL